MTEETHAAAYARLKQISDSLTEVFDSCQIIVTLQDGDESAVFTAGSGSFYARWASLRELVLQWDEFAPRGGEAVCDRGRGRGRTPGRGGEPYGMSTPENQPPSAPAAGSSFDYLWATTAKQECADRIVEARKGVASLQDWMREVDKVLEEHQMGDRISDGFDIHWATVMMEKALHIYNEIARCNGAAVVRGTNP